MKKSQRGFTLIELVTVIVILGILSAVAIPKYIDYRESAGLAAVKGVAAALGSAAAINYAASVARMPNSKSVKSCSQVASLLEGGGLPVNFAFVENNGRVGTVASTTTPGAISTTVNTAEVLEVKAVEAVTDTATGTITTAAISPVAGVAAYDTNTTKGNVDSTGVVTESSIYTCTVKGTQFNAMATFTFTPI